MQRLAAPPSTAASACTVTRTMLFSGCWAVSMLPAVWAWKRSMSERGSRALKRSRMMRAHSRRAARYLAISYGAGEGGGLRAVAITTQNRFPGLPGVPTVIESGVPGYEVASWNGIAAPAKTPRPVIDRLNKEINAVLALPDVKQRFDELGVIPQGGTPEELGALLTKEIAKWKDVVAKAKIEKQ